DIVYAGTGSYYEYGAGILKSTDTGATWTNLPGPFATLTNNDSYFGGGARIFGITVHPTNSQILLAAVWRWPSNLAGIYRSTDGGVSWTQKLSGANGTSVFFNPQNPNIAYAALADYYTNAANGIYKSIDGGLTWTPDNGTTNAI